MNLLVLKNGEFELGAGKLELLGSEDPGVKIEQVESARVTDEQLKRADIIFGWPSPARLKEAESLKWLHLPSAGVDAYTDLTLYANKEVIVTRSKDVYNIPIAEHSIMLFLSLSRGMLPSVKSTFEGKWTRISGQTELTGSTVLIVGAGGLGGELAKRLSGFDCHIIGIKRDPLVKPPYFDEIYTEAELDSVLPRADYVALCLPRTPETKGMFDYRRLSLMKRTAVIVNVGRGDAIVSDDIARALNEGIIAGAGLDVTEPEPLPEGHALWSAPNLIITSHTSGHSVNSNDRRFELFYDLYKNYLAGRNLYNKVDFLRGY